MSQSIFPTTGLVRLNQILTVFPISRSSWYAGVRAGKYPAPTKLGPRTAVWRAEDVFELIDRISSGNAKHMTASETSSQ